MLIREGSNLNTVFHAENGTDGEGRVVGNTAIIAIRKDGVALPETDKVVGETEKATQKPSSTKKPSKTEKVTDDDIDVESNDSTNASTEPVAEGGCGGMIALPAVIATSGIAVFGISKKRGKERKKK